MSTVQREKEAVLQKTHSLLPAQSFGSRVPLLRYPQNRQHRNKRRYTHRKKVELDRACENTRQSDEQSKRRDEIPNRRVGIPSEKKRASVNVYHTGSYQLPH